jgi:hypothetical protein
VAVSERGRRAPRHRRWQQDEREDGRDGRRFRAVRWPIRGSIRHGYRYPS